MGNERIIGGKGTKIARVDQMTTSLKAHLTAISNWFDDPKVTLIVRTEAGGDLIMTNDRTAEAVAALRENDSDTPEGVLPPLPKPAKFDHDHVADLGVPMYSESQMLAYARRAKAN